MRQNNPKKSPTTKLNKHTPMDLALIMIIKDIVKSEIIAITLENIDELLMIFAF